ncbi:MAG: ABC transporter permease [Defluviitaleaceae bacterium]|nr:ABC transporter permease [Defluviitaleaceae bacterium]
MKLSGNKARVFMTKEFTENLRTKKIFALVCVFVFIALLSVLTARFMGEIFGAMLGAEGTNVPFTIIMPDPVWTDSYAQLYSNLAEMGSIIFIVLFMGAILREKSSGTIDLMMAKGLSATAFVMAKFGVAAILTLGALAVAVFVTYVYTLLLFDYGGQLGNIVFGALPFAVFILMTLALTLMWSAIAKSTAISAVLGFVSFTVVRLLDLLPRIGRFMPGRLLAHGVALSSGGDVDYLPIHIAGAVVITIVSLWVTVYVLRHREG